MPVLERSRPFRHKTINSKERLEDFAHRIEERLRQAGAQQSLVDQACRLIMHKDPRVSALMLCKWVEWRYGKAHEHVEHSGSQTINIVSYIPRPGTTLPNGNVVSLPDEQQSSSPNCDNTVITIPSQAEPKPSGAAEQALERPADTSSPAPGDAGPGVAGGSR
jgi:hypothetical protein